MSGGQDLKYPNSFEVRFSVISPLVVSTLQESPLSTSVVLSGDNQTIPVTTPIVVLTTGGPGTFTGLILAPPLNPNTEARLTLVNNSTGDHEFNTTPATSNVANSDVLESMARLRAYQLIWDPTGQLWYVSGAT